MAEINPSGAVGCIAGAVAGLAGIVLVGLGTPVQALLQQAFF